MPRTTVENTAAMGARIDLADKAAVHTILDRELPSQTAAGDDT